MQLVYLFKGLEVAPRAIVRVVEAVPHWRWDERTDPERFSFREAICHHVDWEPINLERLRRGVESPGCTVEGLDEGQRAIDLNYAAKNPVEEARRFAVLREQTLSYLRTLREEDWRKEYFHSERGRQTVLEQAVAILGHDMYHLEQYTEYLP